ncbi:hypothetical protein ACLK1S_05785 [Escherichia coli]
MQALDTLESKLVDFSALTVALDLSRFHFIDLGTRRRFLGEYKKPSLSVCNRNPGSWAPATTSGASAFPHADGNTGTRMVRAHQQISRI